MCKTALYSILHMLVDGACALAMLGTFTLRKDGYFAILIYNFCAFAMQMPLGALLDAFRQTSRARRLDLPLVTAVAGVLCTILGTLTHPAALGIGNALFHIGGGVGAIHEDSVRGWRGRGLGVFVAPGAFGLCLGSLLAKTGAQKGALWAVCILMALVCAGMVCQQHMAPPERWQRLEYLEHLGQNGGMRNSVRGKIRLASCCVAVVMLRSYIGMAVTFPWKDHGNATVLCTIASVLAIVGGKAAGGFLAARFGSWNAAAASLLLAAFCYGCSAAMPMGIAALFLFNITMPITLYLLYCAFPQMPGFAFGLLTFALFLGFLPKYFGLWQAGAGSLAGSMGSLLSLLILLVGLTDKRRADWRQI